MMTGRTAPADLGGMGAVPPFEDSSAAFRPFRQCYVVGHPVDHSLSPAMHRAAYQMLNLNWSYDLMDCEGTEEARTFLTSGDFLGVNITTPYKPLALELADEADAAARLAHGANVLVRSEGAGIPPEAAPSGRPSGNLDESARESAPKLKAYNVDGVGFVMGLGFSGLDFAKKTIAICGTGPTALSILHALAEMGKESGPVRLALISRNAERAETVLSRYLAERAELGLPAPDCAIAGAAYDSAAGRQALSEADIIVNATRLGLQPGDPAPFPGELLSSRQVVVDAVYGRGETQLCKNAQTAGAFYFSGLPMLTGQAVASLKIFCEAAGEDLSGSCGGCIADEREAAFRRKAASDGDIYGFMSAIPEADQALQSVAGLMI